MKVRLTLSKVSTFVFISYCVSSQVYGYTCEELRSNFQNGVEIHRSLEALQLELTSDNPCFKNLLGTLYARGDVLPKDGDRAYAIFYELSKLDYPPSELNLGIMLARKDAAYDVSTPGYLLGLFSRYYGNMEWWGLS